METLTVIRRALAILFLLTSFAVAAVEDPQQMVRETGDRILAELDTRKADLQNDPSLIYPFVETMILPLFDFRFMSQSALGRFWRNASEGQREALTVEFRELLVRTYASALLDYTDQNVELLPVRSQPDATRVTIPTRLQAPGAPPIPMDYRLRLKGDKWLIYDVVIDGVSLVTNYRSQFAAEVRRGGVDGLIRTLASKNERVSN